MFFNNNNNNKNTYCVCVTVSYGSWPVSGCKLESLFYVRHWPFFFYLLRNTFASFLVWTPLNWLMNPMKKTAKREVAETLEKITLLIPWILGMAYWQSLKAVKPFPELQTYRILEWPFDFWTNSLPPQGSLILMPMHCRIDNWCIHGFCNANPSCLGLGLV